MLLAQDVSRFQWAIHSPTAERLYYSCYDVWSKGMGIEIEIANLEEISKAEFHAPEEIKTYLRSLETPNA